MDRPKTLDCLVPPHARDNPRLRRRYLGVSTSLLTISAIVALFFPFYSTLREAPQTIEIVLLLLSIFSPVLGMLTIRWTGQFVLGLLITNLTGIVLATCWAWMLGGIMSPIAPWYLAMLALLVSYGDLRTSFLTLCMVLAANGILYYGTVTERIPPSLLSPELEARAWLISMVLSLLLLSLGMVMAIQRNHLVKSRLQKSKIEAERANDAKSAFLASMSHELRTPLNAISGFSQLAMHMPHDNLTDQQKEAFEIVIESSAHLLNLINQLLDLSKIEDGTLEVRLQPVSVGRIFKDSTTLIQPTAEEKSVAVEIPYTYPDCWIMADRIQLFQCLLNLTSNAVKYNRDGGRVSLAAKPVEGGNIRLEVSDTGPGIPKELHSRIFQAFDRLDRSGVVSEGTGIGLHITKRLVEGMGGTIGFESEQDKGTLFWITLPQAEPN